MKKNSISILIFLLIVIFRHADAQSESSLQLRLRRDFGYSAGGDIQGAFTMRATGPDNLQRVVFFVDDQEIGSAGQPPFELRFSTDRFPPGKHVLSAQGVTSGGEELQSNTIQINFVTAEEGWNAGLRFVIPILAITAGIVAVSALLSIVGGKKLQNLPAGTPRQYGIHGGAICVRCGRPFPRHFFSPNLIFGKLERCPFCGKWAIVAAVSPDRLREAELAELDESQGRVAQPTSDEERLHKNLDDSRYQDF